MADLSITAANVKAGANALTTSGRAGAAASAGQAVYRDPADGKFKLADNDNASAAVRQVDGIALHAAAVDQPLTVQTGGDITIGAALTPGTSYFLSGTPGGICPQADLSTGDDVILLGLAKSTTVLQLRIIDPGVTL